MYISHSFAYALLLLAALLHAAVGTDNSDRQDGRLRTIITTDMEQDDLSSMIRYLLYTPDIDTQGIIYSSSRFHWSGDGKGTRFYLPDREYNTSQTSWRWTGTRTIQDQILASYAEVYPNLKQHDHFPTPDELLSLVKIGNIDFEGEYSHDTEGSNVIRDLLLDLDTRPIYLQAWGGTNTIARALKSIEDQYAPSQAWPEVQDKINRKAVIMASGFQDITYADYISVKWPGVRIWVAGSVAETWGYHCNSTGEGNTWGPLFSGDWMRANILRGPYGTLSRTWLDGQHMPGDQLDGFGNLTTALRVDEWCPPLSQYDYLGEGDDICYLPLLTTGLQKPSDPTLGGWGGRAVRNQSEPNLWESVPYASERWESAIQNDFAARIEWTLTPEYVNANHPPSVRIDGGPACDIQPGSTIGLVANVVDLDEDDVEVDWWRFSGEDTYPGHVNLSISSDRVARVHIPADMESGQWISIIAEGTDNGVPPLTRYDRMMLQVR